ncbi:MAG: hypothetical protein LBK57_11270 [Clostridiales Family XIII bacterium]|jgi:hypothetical protein|nr:hypothetical protein [Clostridiales Family XIII bacterium]
MYCKVCGNLLEESDLICKVCGANIEEQRKRKSDETTLADVLSAESSEMAFTLSPSPDDADRAITPGEFEASVSPNETDTPVVPYETETPDASGETERSFMPSETETSFVPDETEMSAAQNEDMPVMPSETETPFVPDETEMSAVFDEIEMFAAFDETEMSAALDELEVSFVSDVPETYSQETAASEITGSEPSDRSELFDGSESYFSEALERRRTGRGEFQWNVHQFPSFETRKTEDINFDWSMPPDAYADAYSEDGEDVTNIGADNESADSDVETLEEFFAFREVCDTARSADDTGIEKELCGWADCVSDEERIETEDREFGINEIEESTYATYEKSDFSISDWLHAESAPNMFGNSFSSKGGKRDRERFFTFDKKNEEFQRLLDKEYERLQTYDSPIIHEARDMLALWDLPLGFTGKQTDPSTIRWIPSALNDETKEEARRPDKAGEDVPAVSESEPESSASRQSYEEIPQDAVLEVGRFGYEAGITTEQTSGINTEAGAARYEVSEPDTCAEPEPEIASIRMPVEGAEAESEPYIEPADSEPHIETVDSEPHVKTVDSVPATGTEANIAFNMPQEASPDESFDGTEAELSISKTLDAIEKEIEEWKGRDKLSTVSKVAIVISVIFLIFTGGSAAVKRFAPHSSVDVWFDSIQLQAAATIKHGVDTVRDFFNDSEEEIRGTGE